MAGKFCAFIHPNQIKRHHERAAEGQISSFQQEAAKQLEQRAQFKTQALARIETTRVQTQQEIENMYQVAYNNAATELAKAKEIHEGALVGLSYLWIYGKASINAKHLRQSDELSQLRDLELKSIPTSNKFFNFIFGDSPKYIAQQQAINLKYDALINDLALKTEAELAEFTGHYRGAVKEETVRFKDVLAEHDKLLETIAADKQHRESELNTYINLQKEALEEQYQSDIKSIDKSLQQVTHDINHRLQQQLKVFDSYRKNMALNGGLIIGAAFVSWAIPQLLVGAIANTVQVSAGLTALGATSNLFNDTGTVGVNMTVSVPNNTRAPVQPPYKAPPQPWQDDIKLSNDTNSNNTSHSKDMGASNVTIQKNNLSNHVSSNTQTRATINSANTESGAKRINQVQPSVAKPAPQAIDATKSSGINWSTVWRAFINDRNVEVVNWQRNNRNRFPKVAAFFDGISNSKPQRLVNSFANEFTGRPIRFVSEEAKRLKHGKPTQTVQFAKNSAENLKQATKFVIKDTERLITGEKTETGYFFKNIGNFVADDFERFRNDEATIIGTAIVADFRALANMTPEQLAAHLGHEASNAFLFFIGGGVLQAGGRAATHAIDTALNVGKKFVANVPITFQYQGSRLCSGFPIDAVKLKRPISRSGAKALESGKKTILHQFRIPIDPKIQTPTPVEIYNGYAELTLRQSKLLSELSKPGKFVTINKSDINVIDLAALTAKTGDEFAMFTLGSRRKVFRGYNNVTPISKLNFDKLKQENWKWSAHTHPGTSNTTLLSSGGDRGVLIHIGQEQSLILNSSGRKSIFNAEGNHIYISNNMNKFGWQPK